MLPQLSVCIAVKNRTRVIAGGRTFRLFHRCVRSLQEAAYVLREDMDVELVVVDYESSDIDMRPWLQKQCTPHLPITCVSRSGDFSRGEGLNVAVDAAKYNTVFLCDADMLVHSRALQIGHAYAGAGFAGCPVCVRTKRNGHVSFWEDAGYGLVFVQRRVFLQSGGLPAFHSWGGEDYVLKERLEKLQPIKRYREPRLRHQWHPASFCHVNYRNASSSDMDRYTNKAEYR